MGLITIISPTAILGTPAKWWPGFLFRSPKVIITVERKGQTRNWLIIASLPAGELMSFWSQLGFVFGKFSFVGWSRGWYAEDTENNYSAMVGEDGEANNKPNPSVMIREDIENCSWCY